MRLFVWVSVALIPLSSTFAQDPNVLLTRLQNINELKCELPEGYSYICRNLYRYACGSDEKGDAHVDDGTGVSYTLEEKGRRLKQLKTNSQETLKQKFLKMLHSMNGNYIKLQKTMKAATLQDETEKCSSEQPSDSENCLSLTSEKLAQIEVDEMFSGSGLNDVFLGKRDGRDTDEKSLRALKQSQYWRKEIEPLEAKLKDNILDKRLIKKIETKIFPEVQARLIQKLESVVPDQRVRAKMIDKVKNIRFRGALCDLDEKRDPQVNTSPFVNNAKYEPETNTFRYCNGLLLKSNSEFLIAGAIAHELAHSIDPCNIVIPYGERSAFAYPARSSVIQKEASFPVPGLLSCLRSKEAVGAERDEWYQPDPEASANEAFGSQVFCNSLKNPDQLGESFADWMESEILPEYVAKHFPNLSAREKIDGYSNLIRPMCQPEEQKYGQFREHALSKSRLNRIVMANPAIRTSMGCPADAGYVHYCKPGEKFVGTRSEESIRQKVKERVDDYHRNNGTQKSDCPLCGYGLPPKLSLPPPTDNATP